MEQKKFQKIKRKLKEHEWVEEESLISFHVLDLLCTCYPSLGNVYGIPYFSIVIYYFIKRYYGYEESPREEAREVFNFIFKEVAASPDYLDKKFREFAKISSQIKKVFLEIKKGIKHLSDEKLSNLYKQTSELAKKQYAYSIITESGDALEEKDYLNLMPHVEEREIPKIIQILSAPPELSFMGEERISFLKLCLGFLEKSPFFEKKLKEHVRGFFWIQNSFKEAKYLNKNYFLKEIKKTITDKSPDEIRKELNNLLRKPARIRNIQNKILKQYKLSKKTKIFFKILRKFAMFQDCRKKLVQRVVYCIDQILKEVAKRNNLERSLLDNYTFREVLDLLEDKKPVSKLELKKRYKAVFVAWRENKKVSWEFLVEKQTKEISDFFENRRKELVKEGVISGFVASKGKNPQIRGRVRIVLDPKKVKDFNTGDILVSGMTRPEFLPLMRKARAIITNEGGVTTHAAIVSRELKIPCIVGTKIATAVLRDGDLVEVDANKGIVRKIPKR